jgi:hypothetical protein
MAEPTPVPLGFSSSEGRTPAEGGARFINCHVVNAGQQGKAQYPVYAATGFEAFSTITGTGVGAIRAALALTDQAAYVVTGTKIAKVASNGSATLLDFTADDAGLVTIERNRREPNAQVAIAIGSTEGQLLFVEDDVVTEFTLSDLGSGGILTSLATMAGYFILLMSNGEFYITAIDDDTIDELDFAVAEANPDGGVRVAVLGDLLIVFGTKSTEFWQLSGAGSDFPFERSLVRSYGCYAAGSVANLVQVREGSEVSDTLVFAATDSGGSYLGVCVMSGTSPLKISTPALDRAILAETNPAAIRSHTWSDGERSFYAIHGSAFSFVYDFSTGFWHERRSSELNFWRAQSAFAFGTKTIVGDYASAKLYTLRAGLYNSETASTLVFEHSNDGGQSWITRDARTLSGSSDQRQRQRYNRIGRAKSIGKTFRMTISNAVMEDGTGLSMIVQTPIVHSWPLYAKFAAAHVDIVPGVSQTSRAKGILGLALQPEPITQQAHP